MTQSLEIRRGVVGAIETLLEGWRATRGQYPFLLGATTLGLILGSLAPFGLLMGPAMCGIHLCYLARVDGGHARLDQLLHGFDYFVPSLVVTLLNMAATFLAMVPFAVFYVVGFVLILGSASGQPPFDPLLFVAGGLALFALDFILVINIAFFAMFAYLLVVDRRLNGARAFAVSFKAVWANLGGLAGMLMLASAICLVLVAVPFAHFYFTLPLGWAIVSGILLSLLLTFLTLPPIFGAVTVAYRRIFPAEADSGVACEQTPRRD